MKFRTMQLVVLALFVGFSCFAQAPPGPEQQYHKRLFLLCKIWGHVKYYHPSVAEGKVDIDDVLLNILPDVAESDTDEAFNEVIRSMLEELGKVNDPGTEPFQVVDSLNNNGDLSWIDDDLLAGDVREVLYQIKDFHRARPSVYLDRAFPDGNLTFDNDAKYAQGDDFPDLHLRLLALFRYWNIIHYFFPYKDIMDNDWDELLQAYIPKFTAHASALDYHLGFRELSRNIDDSHAYFLSGVFFNWLGLAYPPFQVRQIEDKMVVTRVLENARDLKPGDIITSVGGQTIEVLREKYLPYAHGSNQESIDKEINTMIMSGPAGNVQLIVDDGEQVKTVTVERTNTHSQLLGEQLQGPAWRIRDIDGICTYAIVNMRMLETVDIPFLFEQLEDVDAVVFDIRNYPQGTLWTLVNYLFEGPIHIANFTVPSIEYPGAFYWKTEIIGQGTASPYQGEVAIVFDERTLSQAEYTVMGLEQFEGAVKVGSRTAAADGNVSYISLPGNIRAVFTGLGTFYPDYSPTQRVGIQPHIEVTPTINGIREGKDEVMLRALQELLPCQLPLAVEVSESTMTLFPNPASSVLNYQLQKSAPVQFKVIDMKGSSHLEGSLPNNKGTLDLSSLPEGAYLLELFTPSGKEAHRFVKE